MNTPTLRLYPSAPLEKDDFEKRLEKGLSDVNCFNNSNNNIREMITYFKDINHKSKNKYKSCKTLFSILESFDTVLNIGATITSLTLSIMGVRLIVVPRYVGIACALPLGIT